MPLAGERRRGAGHRWQRPQAARPGADLPGVVVLRDRADPDALRDTLRPGRRLVIVGAG
jgi:NADPH-dependent 2,4-dienoyl-CoA reductase/sulfur reductase-like enzyme